MVDLATERTRGVAVRVVVVVVVVVDMVGWLVVRLILGLDCCLLWHGDMAFCY